MFGRSRGAASNYVKITEQMLRDLSKLKSKQRYVASYGLNFDFKLINKNIRYDQVILEIIDEFTRTLAIELKTALDNAMESNVWGGSDDSDIVDTGNLRDSLQIEVTSDGVIIDYTAEYAALIHYGGYILPYGNSSATRVYLEGRPWVESVLFGNGPIQGYDAEGLFTRIANERLRR